MTLVIRILVVIGGVEALAVAAIYLPTQWRARGRVGWFLAGLIASLGYMSLVSISNWIFDWPVWLWLPGVIVFDISLALQLSLLLRRRPEQGGARE